MTIACKSAFAAVLALAAVGLSAPSASAMPLGLAPATALSTPGVQIDNVRWVCGPYRCFWRPNSVVPAPLPYWGGPYWAGPYWRRPYLGYYAWRRRW